MLKSASSDPKPDNTKLVELALSGKQPGLLVHLLSPGLTDQIYLKIESSSKFSTTGA